MSPSEPRRKTRKRGSDMRGLADRFQKIPRGMILRIPYDCHADPEPCRRRTLRNGIDAVVGPLGMYIGTQELQQCLHIGLAKQKHVVHRTKSGNELCAG